MKIHCNQLALNVLPRLGTNNTHFLNFASAFACNTRQILKANILPLIRIHLCLAKHLKKKQIRMLINEKKPA